MALLPPPPAFWTFWGPVLPQAARRWNALQVATGWDPTSWYRDPIHNAFVGGDPCSQHTHGFATDWQRRPGSVPQFVFLERARALGFVAVPVAVNGVPSATASHVQVLNAGTLAAHRLCFPRPVIA